MKVSVAVVWNELRQMSVPDTRIYFLQVDRSEVDHLLECNHKYLKDDSDAKERIDLMTLAEKLTSEGKIIYDSKLLDHEIPAITVTYWITAGCYVY